MKNEIIETKSRGGSRPGAGRPAGPKRQQLVVRITPAAHAHLLRIAEREALSRGEVIEWLLSRCK